jgi:glyoxylase-like metal-dependent hydrolase (beta-lactamase superfamily II)
LEPFTADSTVAPGVDVRAAPGHTPGSTIVIVSSSHQRAILLGDVVHCPVELTEPGWEMVYDVDPKVAQHTREAIMREIEGGIIPATAAHFPGMRFGRLLPDSGRSRWTFI